MDVFNRFGNVARIDTEVRSIFELHATSAERLMHFCIFRKIAFVSATESHCKRIVSQPRPVIKVSHGRGREPMMMVSAGVCQHSIKTFRSFRHINCKLITNLCYNVFPTFTTFLASFPSSFASRKRPSQFFFCFLF